MCVKTKYSDMQAKHTHTHTLVFFISLHTRTLFLVWMLSVRVLRYNDDLVDFADILFPWT